jgi:DNA-binding NarL/FixJ family response regulator
MVTVLHEGPPVITDRQRQVIELIAAGCSNEEVARRLGISPRTAKAHSDVLRRKLDACGRRQVAVAALGSDRCRDSGKLGAISCSGLGFGVVT